jgi:hypothetical protein
VCRTFHSAPLILRIDMSCITPSYVLSGNATGDPQTLKNEMDVETLRPPCASSRLL